MSAPAIKIPEVRGLKYFLKIEVKDGDRRVMRDEITVLRLDEKVLKKLNIPGFKIAQIQELILKRSATWRHLGLDYKMKAEIQKLKSLEEL